MKSAKVWMERKITELMAVDGVSDAKAYYENVIVDYRGKQYEFVYIDKLDITYIHEVSFDEKFGNPLTGKVIDYHYGEPDEQTFWFIDGNGDELGWFVTCPLERFVKAAFKYIDELRYEEDFCVPLKGMDLFYKQAVVIRDYFGHGKIVDVSGCGKSECAARVLGEIGQREEWKK